MTWVEVFHMPWKHGKPAFERVGGCGSCTNAVGWVLQSLMWMQAAIPMDPFALAVTSGRTISLPQLYLAIVYFNYYVDQCSFRPGCSRTVPPIILSGKKWVLIWEVIYYDISIHYNSDLIPFFCGSNTTTKYDSYIQYLMVLNFKAHTHYCDNWLEKKDVGPSSSLSTH